MNPRKFLGGKYNDLLLSQIGEYAISESDLTTVQEFIREIFEKFHPSPTHRLMSSFTWWGLATTNYDLIIERSYQTTEAAQVPVPFIENGDRVNEKMRDPQNVMLLKLHGCITRTNNQKVPLILTTDQYIEYKQGRSRIFDHLKDWAFERTIVFVGHSLQDQDLRTMLLELTALTESRPRYFAVVRNVDEIQQRFWETKKVTLIKGTFEEFISTLDGKIPLHARKLSQAKPEITYPIYERFKIKDAVLSQSCINFLQNDVDYVNSVTITESIDAADFYKGLNIGWSAIEQDLDVTRRLADSILSDHFLVEESDHLEGPELILIKAHAGAGKSILMRRIAWNAARDYNYLCIYVRQYGIINVPAIQELINLCKERIFLFVDDAADRVRDIHNLIRGIGPEGKYLTVITAERINEWNMSCSIISPLVTAEYELGYLSHKEIDELLTLLERHHALGTLEHLNKDERHAAFSERAGRQLLVALHEATLGKSFEEIIEDEYSTIFPAEAKNIYLTICVLNRLNVSVRAGIIARIHGVPFDGFKRRLFAPLEHIVFAEYDPIIRDYLYRTRHPHIAQIVFERILNNMEERYDLYIKCLRELNIDYTTDSRAFWQMIRGKNLLDLFPNHELVRLIYNIAKERVGNDPHLLHQMAIYEMNRPNGNLHDSASLLTQAAHSAPRDLPIKHSMAELQLRLLDTGRTPLEREKLMRDASRICRELKSINPDNQYCYHTLVKIGLRKLKDAIDEEAPAITIEELIKDVERNLSEGLQKFPGASHLLESEAQLARLLSDSARAITSLERAFEANPRNAFMAKRLASNYITQGNVDKARSILEKALDANPGERSLHHAYAKLLMSIEKTTGDELAYHFKRAFTPGDTNYDAQLLYARQLFINGDPTSSREIFRQLGLARVGPDLRNKLQYQLEKTLHGQVTRIETTYLFIARDGYNDWVYAHRDNINRKVWDKLTVGTRVSFKIAFTLRGVNAFNVEPEDYTHIAYFPAQA